MAYQSVSYNIAFASTGVQATGPTPSVQGVGEMVKFYYNYTGDAVTDGVLELQGQLFNGGAWETLVIINTDGLDHSVDIYATNSIRLNVTTAEASPTGVLNGVLKDSGGTVNVTDFLFEVAKGSVAGHSSFIVHAHNASVSAAGTEEAWPEGGSITYMTSAETMNIVSTDADDDGDPADTGVRTIEILGLDANYNQISEIVTMNGTTNVLTTNSYLRVYELLAKTAGSSSFNEGIIRATASSAGTVQCHMEAGVGISRCTHYTVPAGKTAYMVQNEMASHKISGGATPEVEFELIVTDSAGCSKRLIDEIINTEVVERIFMADKLPEGLAEKTDIHWVINTDTNVTEVDIRSWILLVDN